MEPVDHPDKDTQEAAEHFYRFALQTLHNARIPFLLGGTYAFTCYTGIERPTKDIDVFVRQDNLAAALEAFAASGCTTEVPFPHWLAKVQCGERFMDVIFNSGNGETPVEEEWFAYAGHGEVLDIPVRLIPPEELLCSKAFIQERERYDGADVLHLLHARAQTLNWRRVLLRFGAKWRVLLAHLVLFGFVYPGERDRVPRQVMDVLMRRLQAEHGRSPTAEERGRCHGTLLSREQYLVDLEQWGYTDARLQPEGQMSAEEIAIWTEAIGS